MFIHLVVIAWLYVAVMMAVAEATSPVGSVLGAVFTFLLYGLLPIGIVVYLLATPARKKARRQREAAEEQAAREAAAAESGAPDERGHAPAGSPVSPVREEP
ncbi:hypothetical protein [Xenophilus azovorans]|uniref:hypothetical protein n=1 Tax=Xenophilus azovorans TaxID=151755 RepID=UPI001B806B7A|nr:hypothetical protein [Xenophilus azovorans]